MTEPDNQPIPTIDDVRLAANFLDGQVVRTPVLRSPTLDAIAGAELLLKAENMQHTGAFKARGALYAVGKLSEAQRQAGLITFSSGNHAQAVALAAKRYGVRADIAMPEDAPVSKVASVRSLGATIEFAGTTSEHRRAAALKIQARTGGTIIQPFDHPDIIAGQGTATLELFEALAAARQSLDALLVPVGGGGLIAGACLVAADKRVPVYAVEPEGCNPMAQSLAAGKLVDVQPRNTVADGLKPVRIGRMNFAIAKRHLAGALTVTDEQIGQAMVTLLLQGKTLVEPSGAAALAAALAGLVAGAPKRIGVLLSGGNIGAARLNEMMSRFSVWSQPASA